MIQIDWTGKPEDSDESPSQDKIHGGGCNSTNHNSIFFSMCKTEKEWSAVEGPKYTGECYIMNECQTHQYRARENSSGCSLGLDQTDVTAEL